MRSNQRCILCWHFSLQGVDLKQRGSSDFNPPLSAAACNLVLRMGGGHVLVLDIKFIRLAAREGWGRDICNQTRTSPIWWRRKGGGKNKKKKTCSPASLERFFTLTGLLQKEEWEVKQRRKKNRMGVLPKPSSKRSVQLKPQNQLIGQCYPWEFITGAWETRHGTFPKALRNQKDTCKEVLRLCVCVCVTDHMN